jgi:hypothetical protein
LDLFYASKRKKWGKNDTKHGIKGLIAKDENTFVTLINDNLI